MTNIESKIFLNNRCIKNSHFLNNPFISLDYLIKLLARILLIYGYYSKIMISFTYSLIMMIESL